MHQVGDVIEQDGVQVRVTEVDEAGTVVATEPIDAEPHEEPTQPDYAAEAARLREENARLAGENRGLRESRREPEPPKPAAPADPYATEFNQIEDAYRAGTISDAERTMRLASLGTEATLARREKQQQEQTAKQRADQAKQRAGQKVAAYVTKFPGLQNPAGQEMGRVNPHLRAVCDELDLAPEDERAQALALERAFGPIDRSLPMDHRDFERRRYPVGGGGGGGGDEPQPTPKGKSKGERVFEKLLPEYQTLYIQQRGSKEAAIKTLEYADETLMRRMGRFAA